MLLFVHRSLWGADLPCSVDFAWHAGYCQAMGLDKSAPFLTNGCCASLFVIILLFALILISQSLGYNTDNHITLQSEPKFAQLYRQHLFIVLFRTLLHRNTQPTTSGSSSTVNPNPGYRIGIPTMLQRQLKSGQVRGQFFVYYISHHESSRSRRQSTHARPVPQSHIASTNLAFSGKSSKREDDWLLIVMDEFSITFALML